MAESLTTRACSARRAARCPARCGSRSSSPCGNGVPVRDVVQVRARLQARHHAAALASSGGSPATRASPRSSAPPPPSTSDARPPARRRRPVRRGRLPRLPRAWSSSTWPSWPRSSARISREIGGAERAGRAPRGAEAAARPGAGVSELLLLGTSHKTAPLDAARARRAARGPRGRVPARARRATRRSARPSCSRRATARSSTSSRRIRSRPRPSLLGMLAREAGLRPTELIDGIYSERNCDAARHLYRVASGLESMVVGEAEVQGQVKRAYEAALAARTTGPLTNQLFRAALATGKRVRTETAIGAGGASVASVAVDAARAALGELRQPPRLHHRRGRDRRADRARRCPSAASRPCSWPTGGATGRSRWPAASAARRSPSTSSRPSSSGPTSSSPRPPPRTRSWGRRSSRS